MQLLIPPVVVVGLVGLLVGFAVGWALVGAAAGLAIGTVCVVSLRRNAVRMVLSASDARPLEPGELPRLRGLVDGLGLANGLPDVDLYLVEDPAVNAMVADGSGQNACLVVTAGLVESLDRVELEGVVGHLLSRIKGGDARWSTLAAVTAGGVPMLADLVERPDRSKVIAVFGRPARVVAPMFGPVLRRVVSSATVGFADVAACRMTRYPPGLVAALEKVGRSAGVTHAATSGTAHLWLEQPLSGVGDDGRPGDSHRRFVTHPPLDERISVLREL